MTADKNTVVRLARSVVDAVPAAQWALWADEVDVDLFERVAELADAVERRGRFTRSTARRSDGP